MTAPLIDPSWHRVQDDEFGPSPSTRTPLDPSSSGRGSPTLSDASSTWSYSDHEELITLDLGPDRIARRSLLGYSASLDSDADPSTGSASHSSSRNVRSARTGSAPSKTAGGSAAHIASGKMLSITGLDTASPLLKIGDTVLRGKRMDLFGTEIVLADQYDPTRPREQQHRLNPIPPSVGAGKARASTTSSTTRRRILFRPLYDPSTQQDSESNANIAALKKLVRPKDYLFPTRSEGVSGEGAARLANLMGGEVRVPQTGVGKGKYKRKEISESEAIIRAAERKVRKAAKLHRKQLEEEEKERSKEQGHDGAQTEGQGEEMQERAEEMDQDQEGEQVEEQEPQPPPSFEPPE